MVGNIEPDGTQNASTTDERTTNATSNASSSDSMFCRIRDFGCGSASLLRQKARRDVVSRGAGRETLP
jgi:hypothetical protein